jgi:transposase
MGAVALRSVVFRSVHLAGAMTLGATVERLVVNLFANARKQLPHASVHDLCVFIHSNYFDFGDQNLQLMSLATCERIVVYHMTEGCTPQSIEGKRKRRLKDRTCPIDDFKDEIVHLIETDCSLYADEISLDLEISMGVQFARNVVCRALHRWGYNLRALHVRAIQRDHARFLRSREHIQQFDARLICCLDETHCDEQKMRRKYGWAKEGFRPIVFQRLTGEKYTFIGLCNYQGFALSACDLIELEAHRGVTAERFLEYFRTKVAPVLGNYAAGEMNSILLLDNAGIHRSVLAEIMDIVRSKGALVLFTAPYCPELNPIEESFNQIKSIVRRNKAIFDRSTADAAATIWGAAAAVSAHDMCGYFRHSGYYIAEPLSLPVLLTAMLLLDGDLD